MRAIVSHSDFLKLRVFVRRGAVAENEVGKNPDIRGALEDPSGHFKKQEGKRPLNLGSGDFRDMNMCSQWGWEVGSSQWLQGGAQQS